MRNHTHTPFRFLRAAAFIAVAPCFTSISTAQDAEVRSPSQLDVPDAYREMEARELSESLDPQSPSYLSPNSRLVWGPITARPHLNTRFTYGNSLRSRSGSNVNTVIEEISPGSLFELGKKWQLDYTPTLSFYSSKEFKDTLAHNVFFGGGTSYGNWLFNASQVYSASSQPLIETGMQTDEETFSTRLGASYYFNSNLMLELGLDQNIRSAQAFTTSGTWSTMDWLNYQISNRLSVGAGLGGGYENVSPGSDMTFEQFQVKVNMRIARKLDFVVNGGGEVRQILDVDGDPLVNPIYGASIHYRPFEHTTLSLSGNRTVSSSLLQGQVSEMTTISAAVSQRLLGLLFLTLSGGFSNNRYITANSLLDVNREDDTTSFAATLAYPFTARGTASVFYNYSDNTSSSGAFSYSSSQVGLQLGYRF